MTTQPRALHTLGQGKRYFRMLPTRWPSLLVKLSSTRCGYASDTVPTFFFSPMSCRSTWRRRPAVGLAAQQRAVPRQPADAQPARSKQAERVTRWAVPAVLTRGTGAQGDVAAQVAATRRVTQAEEGRGAVGQVADHQAVRLAAVLVHHDHVRVVVAAAHLHQLRQHLREEPCDCM